MSLLNESTGTVLFEETTPAPRLFNLVPDLAAETDAERRTRAGVGLASTFGLEITEALRQRRRANGAARQAHFAGRDAVFREHVRRQRADLRNLSSREQQLHDDPDFIRTLPANDPLFVAEFNPALAQLERPQLMRHYGLILENLDGLDDPARKFVMRGVPPTLGLQVTLEKDASLASAPVQMTGWSGDGSPGTGSLREFAIGAVTQHFTRHWRASPAATSGCRPSINSMRWKPFSSRSAAPQISICPRSRSWTRTSRPGRTLFVNGTGDPTAGGTCGFCHVNGGALSINGQNRNFHTNVEGVTHPARDVQDFPKDGGFGQTANPDGTSATAPSTSHRLSRRQTRRRSFTTMS